MDITTQENKIIKYVEQIESVYVKINDDNDICKIHNLFYNDIIDDENNSAIVNLYYGWYNYYKKNYSEMLKYYLLSVDQNNSYAMINLGLYYKGQKNYSEMEKYLLMAIDLNNS